MSKTKHVSRRVLAVLLSITIMLTTFVTFNIGSIMGSAQAAAISMRRFSVLKISLPAVLLPV